MNTSPALQLLSLTASIVCLLAAATASAQSPEPPPLPPGSPRSPAPADTPLSELRDLAEKGDAAAQFALGQRIHDGKGVEKGPAEALQWFRKAALRLVEKE